MRYSPWQRIVVAVVRCIRSAPTRAQMVRYQRFRMHLVPADRGRGNVAANRGVPALTSQAGAAALRYRV